METPTRTRVAQYDSSVWRSSRAEPRQFGYSKTCAAGGRPPGKWIWSGVRQGFGQREPHCVEGGVFFERRAANRLFQRPGVI
jgi:hypothetical protein